MENWTGCTYLKISRLLLQHRMSCVMWSMIRFNHSYLALRFFADLGNHNSIIIFSCSICRWLRIRQSCLVVRETRIDVVARHVRRTRRAAAAVVLDCPQWGGIHSQRHGEHYCHRVRIACRRARGGNGEQRELAASAELLRFALLLRSGRRMKMKVDIAYRRRQLVSS